MASVLHFMPEGSDSDRAVCGARVFLCNDYTDEQHYVDCKRCRRTKAFIEHNPRRFDVDVWNVEGKIVQYRRRATAKEADEMSKEFADDPTLDVVVHELPS